MSSSGSKGPPLRADRRYTNSPKPPAKPAAKTTTARRAAAPKKPRRTRSGRKAPLLLRPFVWAFRVLFGLAWKVGLVATLVLAGFVAFYASTLPPVEELLDARIKGSVTVMDREGKTFAWRGDQYGGVITTKTVSPYLKNAIVATEDKRFYRHFGISPRGVASAISINLSEGRGPLEGNGGSTITQQVAKLLCLGVPFDPEKWKNQTEYEADCRKGSLLRKAKEAVYAMALEWTYSKDDILNIYMNRSFLGAGANGFEAASQRYFGKSSSDLEPAEAAMLAGLLKAPTRYAPTANLKRSQERAATVLKLMEEQGYLTKAEAAAANSHPATLSSAAEAQDGTYFADWVMAAGPSFLTRQTTEDVVIQSTFDPRIQKAAEDAMDFIYDTKVSKDSKAEAAIIVMSADGAVRAMVGGRNTDPLPGDFNRAIQAKRQTGSSFKPFLYAAALDFGFTPYDEVVDEPWCVDVPGSGPYCPTNYDGQYKGRMNLIQALRESRNVPAVKVAMSMGIETVRKIAKDFGIDSPIAAGPAIALGASESTLMEMTAAYAGILNGGTAVVPYGLTDLRLKGDSDPMVGQTGGMGKRVISEQAARHLIYMLHEVVENGTGTRARVKGLEVAGKTGTTSDYKDAWFIGFSADYVIGVWMGYDTPTPMKGVTGGSLPADIWRETMVRVEDGLERHPLPMDIPDPNYIPPVNGQTQPQPQPEPQAQPDGVLTSEDLGVSTGDDVGDQVLDLLLQELQKGL